VISSRSRFTASKSCFILRDKDIGSGGSLALIKISNVIIFSRKQFSQGEADSEENQSSLCCQAEFDRSGLQRDATDMPNRNGRTSKCTRVPKRGRHPSVIQSRRHKGEHCSPFARHPKVTSRRR